MSYKPDAYGGIYGDTYNTPVGRLFWLHLKEPKPVTFAPKEGQAPAAPKFEATCCFDKSNPKTATLKESLQKEVDAMIAHYNQGKKMKLGSCELFQDGDNDVLAEKYPWLRGTWFVTARTRTFEPTKLIDKTGDPYAIADLNSGNKGRIAFQPRIGATGISYSLQAVQFWEDDGQRFGGKGKEASEMFKDACDGDTCGTACDTTKAAEPTALDEEETKPIPVAKSNKQEPKGKAALVNML